MWIRKTRLGTTVVKSLWMKVSTSLVYIHAVLTLVLLDTANVARLEKRVVEGLLLDTGPVTMEETLEPAGGLLELGEDEKVAGGEAGLD